MPTNAARDQLDLWSTTHALTEDPAFIREQLITYIGNKRALLDFIGAGVERVREMLGQEKLRIWDAFSGSGVVSRFFKRYASLLISSDLEAYATLSAKCHLSNRDDVDFARLAKAHRYVNDSWEHEPREGLITRLYAPKNEARITTEDRVFYSRDNARRIDTFRMAIERVDADLRPFLLGPLISKASVHANTSGVFKGFYKDRDTGIGQFGGTNRDALTRILGTITLPMPVLSNFACEVVVTNGDANRLAHELPEVDLAYFDPPYNQHPYGPNYFMLNLIVDYKEPTKLSRVSGIPEDWKRSAYNKAKTAATSFAELVAATRARFILLSYNDEGFIPLDTMLSILERVGTVSLFEREYNTFRGCRNLRDRNIHVTEYLFLVEKTGYASQHGAQGSSSDAARKHDPQRIGQEDGVSADESAFVDGRPSDERVRRRP